MNRSPARLVSKPPLSAVSALSAMTDLERQRTDAALLSLARVLANIAEARSASVRVGGSHAA
jgi:hypothetical protein